LARTLLWEYSCKTKMLELAKLLLGRLGAVPTWRFAAAIM
jgi:hypothetical protein